MSQIFEGDFGERRERRAELERQLTTCDDSEKPAIYQELISICKLLKTKFTIEFDIASGISKIEFEKAMITEFCKLIYYTGKYLKNFDLTIRENVNRLLKLANLEYIYFFENEFEPLLEYRDELVNLIDESDPKFNLILNKLKKSIEIIQHTNEECHDNILKTCENYNALGDLYIEVHLFINKNCPDYQQTFSMECLTKAKRCYGVANDLYERPEVRREIPFTVFHLPLFDQFFKKLLNNIPKLPSQKIDALRQYDTESFEWD